MANLQRLDPFDFGMRPSDIDGDPDSKAQLVKYLNGIYFGQIKRGPF